MGCLLQSQGDYEGAKTTYEEMFELSRELGDKGNTATSLNSLGMVAAQEGDNERVKALSEETMTLANELMRKATRAAHLWGPGR